MYILPHTNHDSNISVRFANVSVVTCRIFHLPLPLAVAAKLSILSHEQKLCLL